LLIQSFRPGCIALIDVLFIHNVQFWLKKTKKYVDCFNSVQFNVHGLKVADNN
jgi:hypothetical protein